jgi:hypothetical protein
MFIVLYAFHLGSPLSLTQALGSVVVATLTLLLVTIPRRFIEAAWFIGLVTLGNASVLFLTFGASTELWLFGAVVVLVTMASYVPTIIDFSAVSSLLIAEYGVILYRETHLDADTVWALPLLLCLTLAFVSKISTAQAEIQRIVKMEDQQPQHRTQADVLTGLPNRAQFLERLTRVVQYVNYNPTFRFAVMSSISMALNPSTIGSAIRRATPSSGTWHEFFKAVCDKGTWWDVTAETSLFSC